MREMYRLLAIAKYDERYVIPPAHAELGDPRARAHQLEETATECSLDYEGGPGMGGSGPFGEARARSRRSPSRPSRRCETRQTAETLAPPEEDRPTRVNLLNWDGKGAPAGPVPAPEPRRRGRPRLAAAAP